MAPLSSLGSTQLTELYAACNKVTAIESLERLGQLQVLELGGNRIRALQGALRRQSTIGGGARLPTHCCAAGGPDCCLAAAPLHPCTP